MNATTPISGITAIMLGVREMPAALAFYRDNLGLAVIMQEPGLSLLQCGAVMLGLSRGHAQSAPHMAGATEVVFRVDSVRAAQQTLTAQGVAFLGEPRQVTPTDWASHFRDVDGHLLSIFGPEGAA
ncbi:MAG: VOC family protein [Candidatus Acidiferrum sp.]|jgi:catechol 2,3-dioxygenase-like lactoylglutathione lyase family enzyme